MEIFSKDCTPREIYKLLTGAVIPRPIAFVSTKSPNGMDNLAPFSFFTPITSAPPIVMFSISERKKVKKDTLVNIEQHPEFVVNIVTEELAVPMHNTAADFKPDISELKEVGLTPVPAKTIDCMAVKESPIHLECKLHKILEIGRRTYMVLGEVVYFYIEERIYMGDFQIDPSKLKPLARIGGPTYARLADFFALDRTFDPKKVIE